MHNVSNLDCDENIKHSPADQSGGGQGGANKGGGQDTPNPKPEATPEPRVQGRDSGGRFLNKEGGELRPGGAAEDLALARRGLEKNHSHIPSASEAKDFRVPDALSSDGRHITEIKDVDSLNLTSQLLDDVEHVTRDGGSGVVDVVIDVRTEVSGPLLDAHNSPTNPINLIREALR